jgi:hypothetical protein
MSLTKLALIASLTPAPAAIFAQTTPTPRWRNLAP